MKRKLAKILTNTSLGTLLLVLIVGPVGAVARIGGLKPHLNIGSFLGARVNSSGETLSRVKSGEVKELNIKTFWGQEATYQRAVELSNTTSSTKTYQLELLEIKGEKPEEQEVTVYFQETKEQTIILEPGEKSWVNIKITAPENAAHKTSTTTLKIAVWTL